MALLIGTVATRDAAARLSIGDFLPNGDDLWWWQNAKWRLEACYSQSLDSWIGYVYMADPVRPKLFTYYTQFRPTDGPVRSMAFLCKWAERQPEW